MYVAASSWFDPGSATVKTVQALGLVALLCAILIGLMLLVLGGIRCWQAWIRRTVNRRGVLGLILVLVGWLLVYVAMGLAFTLYRYLSWPLVGVALISFCAGLVMGLLGLAQIKRHPKWFNYGRGHAIAALWGGGGPLALVVIMTAIAFWVYRADLGMVRLLARGYHESDAFGYRVNLSGSLWKTWDENDGRLKGLDFGVVGLIGDRGLFVLPVVLPPRNEFDPGAIAEALLGEVGRRPGEPKLEKIPAPSGATEDENQFEIFVQREKVGTAHRYRVAVHRGVAYLIGAWMDQRLGASRERLDEEVMRVSLGKGEGPKSPGSADNADAAALRARVYRRMAANLTRRGMNAEAATWSEAAQALDGSAGAVAGPRDTGDALAKALFALDLGNAEKALEFATLAVGQNPTNDAAMAVKALATAASGKLAEGLKLVPSGAGATSIALSAAGDYLRALKAKDIGSVFGIPVEAVPVPSQLLKPQEPSEAGRARGVAYDWTVWALRFRRGEPIAISRYGRVRAFSEKGAKGFREIVEEFDPRVEAPHFDRAVVLDDKGQELSKIGIDAWRVRGDIGDARARLVGPVPELRPGQSVEWLITFQRHVPSLLVPFFSHCFSRRLPARKSVLWIDGDFRSVTASSSSGVPRPLAQPRPHWVVSDPEAKPVTEAYLPPDEVYLPHVWFGEVRKDWQQLALDYMDLVPGSDNGELAAIAQKISSGAEGTEGKVATLSRFVQGHLRSVPDAYGTGQRLPADPMGALSTRQGDSLAHAAVLHALLEAAGINSSLALLCAGGLFHEGIPSVDQFNRMLVFVPGMPQQFVDCYQKERDPIGALPAQLAARRALILDAKEPKTLDIPSMPAVATVELKRRVQLGSDGEISIEEDAQISGAMPAILAERIGWTQGSVGSAKAYLASAKGVNVKTFDVVAGKATGTTQIRVSAQYRHRGAGAPRIPALIETLALDLGSASERRGPAWLGSPLVLNGRLEVSDTSGPVNIGPSNAQLVGRRLVGCAFKDKEGYSYTIERLPGLMSAENFQRLAIEASEVIDAIEPRLAPKPGP